VDYEVKVVNDQPLGKLDQPDVYNPSEQLNGYYAKLYNAQYNRDAGD
jgi:hypothetical protein